MCSQRLLLKVLGSLSVVFSTLFLSLIVSAQEARIITFDPPGADTKPGDNNGTYPSGINAWGAVTGNYVDTKNVLHGFVRSPEGKFTTFEAPGADTTPGSYNGTGPSAINDFGVITGLTMTRPACITVFCGVRMANLQLSMFRGRALTGPFPSD